MLSPRLLCSPHDLAVDRDDARRFDITSRTGKSTVRYHRIGSSQFAAIVSSMDISFSQATRRALWRAYAVTVMSAMLMATPAALGSAAAPGLSVLTSLTPAGARRLAPAPSCRLHPGEQQQQQHKHLVRSPLAVTSRNRRWLVRSLPGLACFLSFFPLEFYRRRKWAVCALDGVRDKRYEALDEG